MGARPRTAVLRSVVGAAVLVAAVFVGVATGTPAQASAASAASLAAANIGKTAGTCAVTPTHNSLGGSQFEHSCVGYAGVPE